MKGILDFHLPSKLANDIYLTLLDKPPSTINEILYYTDRDSEENLREAIDLLIQRKLIIKISYSYSNFPTHYQALPPFSVINDDLEEIKSFLTEKESLEEILGIQLEKVFEKEQTLSLDTLYKDFKKLKNDIKEDTAAIRKETKELVDDMENLGTITEFLYDYEENLKETVSSEMASIVIELIKLKTKFPKDLEKLNITESQWDAIKDKIKDIVTLETHQKAQEIQKVISKEFQDIRTKLDEKLSLSLEQNFEQNSVYLGIMNIFMSEVKKLHKVLLLKKNNLENGLDKLAGKVQEIVIATLNENFSQVDEKIKGSMNFLEKLIEKYAERKQNGLNSLKPLHTREMFKEGLLALLNGSNNVQDALLLVPNIENFIPKKLMGFQSNDELIQKIKKMDQKARNQRKAKTNKEKIAKKRRKKTKASANQKKKLEKMFEDIRKKARDMKGYELTHPIADILALILDINEKSAVKKNIQSWLNRLTTIRKSLDSDLKFLLLDDVDKWEKNYLKIEEEPSKDKEKEVQVSKSDDEIKEIEKEKTSDSENKKKPKIRIISSESHSDNIIRLLEGSKTFTYKRLDKNNLIGLLKDNSLLIFGIYDKKAQVPSQEVKGFITTNKEYISHFQTLFEQKWQEASFEKDKEITDGFNEILKNINKYTGQKIGTLIQDALDFTFQKEGVSLNVLELKILGKKLRKVHERLCEEDKQEVINKIQELNQQISTYELIEPPALRQIPSEEGESPVCHIEVKEAKERKVDEEKIEELFNLFIERIDNLTGKQICGQISQIMELVMRFQGFSEIIEWKDKLDEISTKLDEPFKEKLLQDFVQWKNDILSSSLQKSTQTLSSQKMEKTSTSKPTSNQALGGYSSPAFQDTNSQETGSNQQIEPKNDIHAIADDIFENGSSYTGTQISNQLQNIMDIIMEEKGFTAVPKELKFWKGKLRMNRKRLPESIQDDFLEEFQNWYESYKEGSPHSEAPESPQSQEQKNAKESSSPSPKPKPEEIKKEANYSAQTEKMQSRASSSDLSEEDKEKLGKFDKILAELDDLKGFEISKKLQAIMDDILETEGYSMALKDMRQWISKLRMIREPLKPEKKEEFLGAFEKWRDKYSPKKQEDEFDGYKPGFLK